MLKPNPILLAMIALLVASLACTTPSVTVSTPDGNLIGTMIAQTVTVAGTQTAQAVIPISPTPIFTLEPTLSPTSTLSPTPVFTSTPAVPMISVSVATNCRVGPGRAYDRIGALLVDEVAEIFGRDASGNYWYIRNPDSSNGYCWLWGEYASLVGNVSALPIFTPPPTPTPTPAFVAEYARLETCVGWWVDLRLENTGGAAFRSISITVRDITTDVVVASTANGFTNNDGCSGSAQRDVLEPGDRRVVSAPAFVYDPTGHDLRATITLCSNTGVTGLCTSQVINFKP